METTKKEKKKKVLTKKCNFCDCEKQTSIHLFSECIPIKNLWHEVVQAIKKVYTNFVFRKDIMLLGTAGLEGALKIALNYIIVMSWQQIANSNNYTRSLTIEDIKFRLNNLKSYENCESKNFRNCKLKRHKKIWKMIQMTGLFEN
jgi:hypothetical protein